VSRPHPEVIAYLAAQGRKNKGKKRPACRRGDSEYYRKLAQLRWAKKKTP
jgi:hypothetical protein